MYYFKVTIEIDDGEVGSVTMRERECDDGVTSSYEMASVIEAASGYIPDYGRWLAEVFHEVIMEDPRGYFEGDDWSEIANRLLAIKVAGWRRKEKREKRERQP